GLRLTIAATAPLARASATKSCPSKRSPLSATYKSPGLVLRLSMETRRTCQLPVALPPVASLAESCVHMLMPPIATPLRLALLRPHQRTDRSCRRQSGFFHGPYRQ